MIRPARPEERVGLDPVARRGELVDPRTLEAAVAVDDGVVRGLVTWAVRGAECEVVTVDGPGVGAHLMDAAVEAARAAGCTRLWLVTTNDNLRALRFYQRYGLKLTALRPGAVDEARRRLKPTIPPTGEDGLPIRDELELAIDL